MRSRTSRYEGIGRHVQVGALIISSRCLFFAAMAFLPPSSASVMRTVNRSIPFLKMVISTGGAGNAELPFTWIAIGLRIFQSFHIVIRMVPAFPRAEHLPGLIHRCSIEIAFRISDELKAESLIKQSQE